MTSSQPPQPPADTEADLFLKGANPLIVDGVLSQAMNALVGGAFLAAFALALGANQFQIGLLAALPPLGQFMQVPAVVLIRRLGNRKRIAATSAVVSRLVWYLMAAMPFVLTGNAALSAVSVLILASAAAGDVGGVAWRSWMRDLVPEELMGRYFSKRMAIANTVGIAVSLAAGFFMDLWQGAGHTQLTGFSLLFAAGATLGLFGLFFLIQVGEPHRRPDPSAVNLGTMTRDLIEPFRNSNFRKLMAFSASWTLAITFAAPFFIVYMLDRIGLQFSLVIVLTVVSQVFNVLFLSFWGRISDRFSNTSVLGSAGLVLLAAILGWTFTTLPERYFFTVPLLFILHALMGLSMGGISLATGNIGMKLSPRGGAEAYVASLALVNAVAAFAGPLIAGTLGSFFAGKELTITFSWLDDQTLIAVPTVSLRGLDFLFLIAVLLGLYAMHRLAFVHEEGDVSESVVFEEMREKIKEDMRAMASFSTLRQVVTFSGYLAGRLPRGRREAGTDDEQ